MRPRVTRTLAFVVTMAACTAAFAADCGNPEVAKATTLSFDRDIEALRTRLKRHESRLQDEIKAAADDRVKRGRWTVDQSSSYFSSTVSSDAFQADEQRKQPVLATFMTDARAFVDARTAQRYGDACVAANDALARLMEIGTINDAQYDRMLKGIRVAR